MLKYDSQHGRFDGTIEVGSDHLVVNGKKVMFYMKKDPSEVSKLLSQLGPGSRVSGTH